MGYAVLHYANKDTIPLGHVVHDIVGILTGTYTNVNQLSASASSGLCTIVNSAGRGNWEFVYPATHGSRSTTTFTYILRSRVESSASKYKFIRITSHGANGYINTESNLKGPGSSYGYGSYGILVQGCSAAASTTSISNATPYFENYDNYQSRWYSRHPLIGPNFYLSWSSRHCLIISPGINSTGAVNSDLCFFANFEHTETSISTYRSVAPFCHLSYFGDTYDTTAVTGGTNYGIFNDSRYSYFNVFNHYKPSTATASGSINLWADINSQGHDMPIVSTSGTTYPTVATKTSAGTMATYMQPLFFHQHHIGVPHQYISNLCDVYRVPNNLGNPNDTMTVGADTYVYFPLTGSWGLAIKRA